MAKKVVIKKLSPIVLSLDDGKDYRLEYSYFELLKSHRNLERFIEILRLYDDGYITKDEFFRELSKIEKEMTVDWDKMVNWIYVFLIILFLITVVVNIIK